MMDRDQLPLCSTARPTYQQMNELVDLETYLKARSLSRKRNFTSPGRRLSADTIKRLFPRRHRSKVAIRSPVLTSGITIRDKDGEPIVPPVCGGTEPYQGRKKLTRQVPLNRIKVQPSQKPVTKVKATESTALLSPQDFTLSLGTFYVNKALEELDDTIKDEDAGNMSQCMNTPLTDISHITRSSNATVREQASAMIDMSTDILHSTLNYPLSSTMATEPLPIHDCSTDSSSLSFCVDDEHFPGSAPTTYPPRKLLRRQTAHRLLNKPQPPVSVTESDLEHDDCTAHTGNISMNATCGTYLDNEEDDDAVANVSTEVSWDSDTDTMEVTLVEMAESTLVQAPTTKSTSSSSSSKSHSSSESSMNLSKEKKRELKKKLKNFNKSLNSNNSHLEITTLGIL